MRTLEVLENLRSFYRDCLSKGYCKIVSKNGVVSARSSDVNLTPFPPLFLYFKEVCYITPKLSKKNYDLLDYFIKGYDSSTLINIDINIKRNFMKLALLDSEGFVITKAKLKLATINFGKFLGENK